MNLRFTRHWNRRQEQTADCSLKNLFETPKAFTEIQDMADQQSFRQLNLLANLRNHLLTKTATVISVTAVLNTFGVDINNGDEYFKDILRAAFTNGSLEVFILLEDRGFIYNPFDVLVRGHNYKSTDKGDQEDGEYEALFGHMGIHTTFANLEKGDKVLIRRIFLPMLDGKLHNTFMTELARLFFP